LYFLLTVSFNWSFSCSCRCSCCCSYSCSWRCRCCYCCCCCCCSCRFETRRCRARGRLNIFWRLHWQLFVFGAVSDYWVEHLSLACAICWASCCHKPPILEQLVILILNEIVFYCKYRANYCKYRFKYSKTCIFASLFLLAIINLFIQVIFLNLITYKIELLKRNKMIFRKTCKCTPIRNHNYSNLTILWEG